MLKTTTACFAILFSSALPVFAGGAADLEENDIASKSVEALRALQTELKIEIDAIIGEAKCDDDNHCGAIAIGANPCGGPETYKAYSVLDTDVNRIKNLADQYKTVRKMLHVKTGTMGACMVIPEPDVQCKGQHCVLIPTTGGLIF